MDVEEIGITEVSRIEYTVRNTHFQCVAKQLHAKLREKACKIPSGEENKW